jgi:2-isopropylmalate synthase
VPPNKAIVGKNAFWHESGIHQDAIIKQRTTYEIMNPKDVGIGESELVLGKHSGRHALSKRFELLGFHVTQEKLDKLFVKFKELADKKKDIFDDDLIALADEETRDNIKAYKLISLKVNTGTDITPQADVSISLGKKIISAKSIGDGPVDACYKAIDKITSISPKLLNYELEAVTRGKDAQGMVKVELQFKNEVYSGRGSSTDILEASVKAYLDALNKIVSMKE